MNRRVPVRVRGRVCRLSPCRGVVLLEAIVAILIFSIGVTGALLLVATAVRENGAALYRAQAALLIDGAIADMWTGDRSHTGIATRYAANATTFKEWSTRVAATLPGVAGSTPTVLVSPDNTITITVRWREPGKTAFHELVTVTRVVQ